MFDEAFLYEKFSLLLAMNEFENAQWRQDMIPNC